MLTTYRMDQGRVVQVPDGAGPILLFVDPTDSERALLVSQHGIDEHNLTSAQDPDELPRVELDNSHMAVIFKHPKRYSAKDNFVFRINSVGLFLFKDRLIVIAPSDMGVFDGRAFTKIQNLQLLFLRILSTCISHFFSHLQVINDIANELEPKIVTSMENRNLLLMFSIEKSLVYYVNAISANGRVIERLKTNAKNPQTEGLSLEMLEYVDDLAIENAQCLEQAQVYANVFTGLMDARASIVSNNLNVWMKRLTALNLVFLPPVVLTGMFGMSEYTMMTQNIPWPVSYGLFVLAMVVIGFATYYFLLRMEKKTMGS